MPLLDFLFDWAAPGVARELLNVVWFVTAVVLAVGLALLVAKFIEIASNWD